MEKSETENMQNYKEKQVMKEDDDVPKINYRGWKVMPFIIGKIILRNENSLMFLSFSFLLIFFYAENY